MDNVARLLDLQSGVIARPQLLSSGLADHDIKRMVRRRELARICRGVLVDHTGQPTWLQSAWSAILSASQFGAEGDAHGACLCAQSALRLLNGPGTRAISDPRHHVLVDARRTLVAPQGVVVHRSRDFRDRCAGGYPPHVTYADAALDVATAAKDRWSAIAVLAQAVGDGRTTAQHISELCQRRSRVRGRAWVERVIEDIGAGTCSVLEHGFLNDVVRVHGLPTPRLQGREETAIGVVYRDVRYGELNVELDGRPYHSTPERRNADLDRDLVATMMGQRTVRLGWGQVFGTPCRTAAALAALIGCDMRVCRRSSCGVLVTR